MSGLILIDRSMLSHHIVGIKNPLRFSAWAWMLSEARYKPGIYFHHGHEIPLEIGQFACARSYMASKTGMTDKQIRTFLTALERAGMVTKTVHQKGQGISIISIAKYAEYQDFSKYREMKGPVKGPAKGQGGAKVGPDSVTPEGTPEGTPEEGAAKAPTPRGSRLYSDWFLPKEYGDWAVSEGFSEERIRLEADQFKDWWLAKSGKDATKMDWLATWRNWMRKTPKEIINGKRTNNGQARGDAQFDEARQRAIDVGKSGKTQNAGGF